MIIARVLILALAGVAQCVLGSQHAQALDEKQGFHVLEGELEAQGMASIAICSLMHRLLIRKNVCSTRRS